jgi:hypothetical protein
MTLLYTSQTEDDAIPWRYSLSLVAVASTASTKPRSPTLRNRALKYDSTRKDHMICSVNRKHNKQRPNGFVHLEAQHFSRD